ncbi:MAG: hypothetical protein EBV10_07850 [Synechococcaceae bacterium WB6_1A_059]|nr:hypothetical protein [Synechococcaceae bacterium WB6_1A_059]
MYALFTMHDEKYEALAKYTWDQNKVIYANKHGYAYHKKPFTGAFDKIRFTKELMVLHPEYEWLWWTGCDSMITNMEIRIQDRIMNQYHFIISVDVNGLNSDSFLIRNTPEGMSLIDDFLSQESEAMKHWDEDQRGMTMALGLPYTASPEWPVPGPIELEGKYKNIVKIVAQKYMNSYNYSFYPQYLDQRDKSGVNGNWNFGDWLIHWPALSLDQRVQCFHAYQPAVLR